MPNTLTNNLTFIIIIYLLVSHYIQFSNNIQTTNIYLPIHTCTFISMCGLIAQKKLQLYSAYNLHAS